jgi:secreted trypsin-like serine protease
VRAGPSISFFYPQSLSETTCTGDRSWTKWFNSAKPNDNGNLDREVVSVIQGQNGRDMCSAPQGIQAQSVGTLANGANYGASWQTQNGLISVFSSTTPGLDFQVRFCCANSGFVTTTTTTTTPRPIASSTCGRQQIEPSLLASRIFGGSHAVPNSWPWQVLYEERKPCGTNRVCTGSCGGTLIDSRHVLTAAHCIGELIPSRITITAGLHDKRISEQDTRQARSVERIFMHPGWDSARLANDIAILRLTEPVQFNKFVQPACLPGPDPEPDSEVVLIGWGAEQFGGSPYHQLKQAQVKVIGQCEKYWGQQIDNEKQICVAHRTSGFSACQGDSGGPMLQKHNNQWIVQGVTSFISDCKTHDNLLPNVYVRVSAYLPWIKSII